MELFPRSIPNIASQCTLSVDGWDNSPSDLEKAVDGDFETATTAGSTTLDGEGYYGYLNVTMPEKGVYLVGLKCSQWCTAGNPSVSVWIIRGGEWSFTGLVIGTTPTPTEEKIRSGNLAILVVDADEVRFGFKVNAAATAYAKIYEVVVFKLL